MPDRKIVIQVSAEKHVIVSDETLKQLAGPRHVKGANDEDKLVDPTDEDVNAAYTKWRDNEIEVAKRNFIAANPGSRSVTASLKNEIEV